MRRCAVPWRHTREYTEQFVYRLHNRVFQQKIIRAIACTVAVILSFGLAIWLDESMWQRNIAAFVGAMFVFLTGAIAQRFLRWCGG